MKAMLERMIACGSTRVFGISAVFGKKCRPVAVSAMVCLLSVAASAPAKPGLYLNGQLVPFGSVGVGVGLPPPLVWRPDESDGDAELQRLRKRYDGKIVHGFGGVTISCAGWRRTYSSATPLRVVRVERERGTIANIGTGNQLGVDMYGASFSAVDPLRFVFAPTSAKPVAQYGGENGDKGDCPALVLADFQVDVSLSLSTPPPDAPYDAAIYPGMTREDVIWSHGYPWEVADKATLLGEDTWNYGVNRGFYAVHFMGGRVISVDVRCVTARNWVQTRRSLRSPLSCG